MSFDKDAIEEAFTEARQAAEILSEVNHDVFEERGKTAEEGSKILAPIVKAAAHAFMESLMFEVEFQAKHGTEVTIDDLVHAWNTHGGSSWKDAPEPVIKMIDLVEHWEGRSPTGYRSRARRLDKGNPRVSGDTRDL